MQFCDVPAALPPTLDAILAEARAERLFPGDGGLNLVALLRAVPRDIPLSVEVPMHTLARSVGATERAQRSAPQALQMRGLGVRSHRAAT